MSAFWTSFFDGFTLAGIFGDLRRPGAPDRLFEPEPEEEPQARTIVVLRAGPGVEVRADELDRVVFAVRKAVNETAGSKVEVTVPTERHAAG
jgi:hypothetical protein